MLANCSCGGRGKGAGGVSPAVQGGLTVPKAIPCFLLVNLGLLGLSYLVTVDTGQDCIAEPAGTMSFPATHLTLGCTL